MLGKSGDVLPMGTLTFLLTDMEGSSRLWEMNPGRMSSVIARRYAIIDEATRKHNGVLPLEQGEGDSSLSVFARASDAAACAVDIQRALAEESWPQGAEVRVRVALHTGEAELSESTYLGTTVNRCARLRSLGHGGQILLSQATYELLVDGMVEDITFRGLGVHRLRDLARPEHVWQLCHPELLDAFPPLRSLGATANNLPVELTSFVGRETEIAAVKASLEAHRLVTLAGAGGSGKTRLAIQVASAVAERHPDGIWWVDMAPLADPSLVAPTLAGVLGLRESASEPIIETIVGYLSTRRALVVLDNCEHVIGACASLAARMVQGCRDVTIVATSREPLRVDGEYTWPVPPLSLPVEADHGSLEGSEAVRLFLDRAHSANPGSARAEANMAAVAEICRRLDGIPLAIELAAARTRMLTVDQIAEALADRFHLLTGGARTALPRQRTLENSVDWSHDLLSEDERTVLRRLSVFAGTFTLGAAEEVCAEGATVREHVLDWLCALVDRSLVQVADESGAETRYRMLETIRDYARRKLSDAGEAERCRDRYLDHYVMFSERASEGLEGPGLVDWLERIDVELDNLRAGLDWAPRSTAPDRGARIVGLLWLYWFARSELAVGRPRLEAAADGGTQGTDAAGALSSLCIVEYRAGDMTRAVAHGTEAVAIARRVGDPRLIGRTLHARAWALFWGKADRFAAWRDFEEADELLRSAGDGTFLALNLVLHGWSCTWTDEAPLARGLLEEGLAISRATDAPHVRCFAHLVLGFLDIVEGDLPGAVRHLDRSLELNREIGDPYAEYFGLCFRGLADGCRGDYAEARDACERGLATAREHRSLNGQLLLEGMLSTLDLMEGRIHALPAQDTAKPGYAKVFPQYASIPLAHLAEMARVAGRTRDSHLYATMALDQARRDGVTRGIEDALLTLARLAHLDGEAHLGEDLCHEALEIAWRVGHLPDLCQVFEALAGMVADQGRCEDAARLWGAADAMRTSLGYAMFPVHRASYQDDISSVRDALGSHAFREAWNEGAALSLEDAVAYVRRGRGRRKRPAHGWGSLTPTELQVVELVAEGLTNPQIGQRLFVSPRTVQSHLASVFGKLAVSTRAEVAAIVATRRANTS